MKVRNIRHTIILLISAGLFNFVVYYGCRYLVRGMPHFHFATPLDDAIPLLPWTIVIYWGASLFWILRQYRTILAAQMRQGIFRQTNQKPQGILGVFARIFGKYDGKFTSRCVAKAVAVNCAVLP